MVDRICEWYPYGLLVDDTRKASLVYTTDGRWVNLFFGDGRKAAPGEMVVARCFRENDSKLYSCWEVLEDGD